MTQEVTDWLLGDLDRSKARLLTTANREITTAADREIVRLAMDQVSGIQSQRKVVEIAAKALADGADPRFAQIIAWLAYTRSAAPGYLETWAPDEIDLISTLDDCDLGGDPDFDGR